MTIKSLPLYSLIMIFALAPLVAATPPGFRRWTPQQLKAISRRLAKHLDREHQASTTLARFGGSHWTMMAYREASGGAEMHAHASDMFVVESGTATLVVGGRIVDPRLVSPGETRGRTIRGGSRVRLRPGDVVNIPPNTPHQIRLARGVKFAYFVIKIKEK